jgi:hypothetical protein
VATDLLFLQAQHTAPPIPLAFGDTPDAPSVDVALDADLGDVSFEALVVSMTVASMEVDFGQLQFDALAIPVISTLNDLLFRLPPLAAPPVDLMFETVH